MVIIIGSLIVGGMMAVFCMCMAKAAGYASRMEEEGFFMPDRGNGEG